MEIFSFLKTNYTSFYSYKGLYQWKAPIAIATFGYLTGGLQSALFALGAYSLSKLAIGICSKTDKFFEQKQPIPEVLEKMRNFKPSQAAEWFRFFHNNKDEYNQPKEHERALSLLMAMDRTIPKELILLAQRAGIRFDQTETGLFGNSPLIWAVANANNETAVVLLNEKTCLKINHQDSAFGNSALHLAVCKGYRTQSYHGPISVSNLTLVKALLENGADPNLQNHKGNTAYHIACAAHDEEMIELLVRFGADPKIQNKKGQTPLDCLKLPHEESVEILIDTHGLFVMPPRNKGGPFQLYRAFNFS